MLSVRIYRITMLENIKHASHLPSRAHTRAYSQEFYVFYCHICHTNTLSHYVSTHCLASKQKFNNIVSYISIFRAVWQFFKGVFHQSFHAISSRPFQHWERSVTDVTAKKTILLGNTRARSAGEQKNWRRGRQSLSARIMSYWRYRP